MIASLCKQLRSEGLIWCRIQYHLPKTVSKICAVSITVLVRFCCGGGGGVSFPLTLRHKSETILFDPLSMWLLSLSLSVSVSLVLYLNVLMSRFLRLDPRVISACSSTQSHINTQACCPYKGLSVNFLLKVMYAKKKTRCICIGGKRVLTPIYLSLVDFP